MCELQRACFSGVVLDWCCCYPIYRSLELPLLPDFSLSWRAWRVTIKLSAVDMTLPYFVYSGALTFLASYMSSFSFCFASSRVCVERASWTLSVYPREDAVALTISSTSCYISSTLWLKSFVFWELFSTLFFSSSTCAYMMTACVERTTCLASILESALRILSLSYLPII